MTADRGDERQQKLAKLMEIRRAGTRRMRRGSIFAGAWGTLLCTFSATALFTDELSGGDTQFFRACALIGSMGLASAGYGFYVVRDREKNDVLLQRQEDIPREEVPRLVRRTVLTALSVGVFCSGASGALWYVLFGFTAGLAAFCGTVIFFGLLFWFLWPKTIGRIPAQLKESDAPESMT